MTQESQISEGKMETLGYYKNASFADFSPRRVNRIMKRLADKVARACISSEIHSEKGRCCDLNTEFYSMAKPGFLNMSNKNLIYRTRVHDDFGIIDAEFRYNPPYYRYPSPLEERSYPNSEPVLPELRLSAYIYGTIKYNPAFFKRPRDVKRLKRIARK